MLATCMKTLVWSFLFGFVVMTMWAMLMVEMVNDLILDVASRTDVFDECGEQCLQAASSVMNANLLLFKTVVAGDSWGLIAVPVIQVGLVKLAFHWLLAARHVCDVCSWPGLPGNCHHFRRLPVNTGHLAWGCWGCVVCGMSAQATRMQSTISVAETW